METAAALVDRGQNPIRRNLRRQVHPLMNETGLADKIPCVVAAREARGLLTL